MELRGGQEEHRVTTHSLTGPPVMVIEDDPLVGELLTLRLEGAGYRVSWAKTGREALDRLFTIMPKLLLLDLGLPVMDGFEVLGKVRRHRAFAGVPVVVLTVRNDAADVRRAISLGATDYMTKPFEAPVLLKRLARHIATAENRRRPTRRGGGEWVVG